MKRFIFSTKENDWVEIRCGKAHFNIVGLSSDEFPYFPKVNDDSFITLNNAILREMIEKTSYAICHDETKYNLNGVFVKALEENGRNAPQDGGDRRPSSFHCRKGTVRHHLPRNWQKGSFSRKKGYSN